MKNRHLLLSALSVLLLSVVFSACKQDDPPKDPNVAYINNFYGIDMPHVFTFQNPTDEKTSRKVTLTWDANGKVAITTVTIPREMANENRQIAYLPITEIDTTNKTFRPTNTVVKTRFYDVTSQDYLNCTNGYYYCAGCGPLNYGYYQLGTGYYYGMKCGNNAPSSTCGPFWKCNGGGSVDCPTCQIIALQTL